MFHIMRRKYCAILLLLLASPVWAKGNKTVLYNQGGLIITVY
jgi:hypothetical protein